MTRDQACARLESENDGFDIVVIGGGASGAGIAFDAAWRGYRVALFERGAFGAGTSSRSSKLIHGGLRYLGLGQLGLVREALHERARLLANAPAIVAPLGFVIPTYSRFERCKFRLGLALYDRLAGAERLQRSHALDTTQLRQCAPTVVSAGLRGALWYADAGFDDSRLLLALLAGARRAGALTLNHAEVTALLPDSNGRIGGVVVHDRESDREHEVRARVVINAGGPYGDAVRALEGASARVRVIAANTPQNLREELLRIERAFAKGGAAEPLFVLLFGSTILRESNLNRRVVTAVLLIVLGVMVISARPSG